MAAELTMVWAERHGYYISMSTNANWRVGRGSGFSDWTLWYQAFKSYPLAPLEPVFLYDFPSAEAAMRHAEAIAALEDL